MGEEQSKFRYSRPRTYGRAGEETRAESVRGGGDKRKRERKSYRVRERKRGVREGGEGGRERERRKMREREERDVCEREGARERKTGGHYRQHPLQGYAAAAATTTTSSSSSADDSERRSRAGGLRAIRVAAEPTTRMARRAPSCLAGPSGVW